MEDHETRRPLKHEGIPEHLRPLAHLAERWGLSGDTSRHLAGERATEAERLEIRNALRDRHQQIEDWLYSFGDDPMSEEAVAYQYLLVFELEECDGPGISGVLTHALRKYREAPSATNRERLYRAYANIAAAARNVGDRRLFEPELSEAEQLLVNGRAHS